MFGADRRSSLLRRCRSLSVAIEVPLSVIEGANRASLQPPRDAVEVEGVIADTPSLVALFFRVGDLIGLAVYAGLHDMIPADGTIVDVDIPGPKGDGRPFFHFESFLRCSFDHFSLKTFFFFLVNYDY